MPQETKTVLMSDDMLYGYNAKLGAGIQCFLESIDSWLAVFNVGDMTFSEFLNSICREADKNPLYFLALIQKEQSAVQKTKQPSKNILDKIVGYGCPEGGGKNPKYAGFETQLRSAVRQLGRYDSWAPVKNWRTNKIKLYDSKSTLKKYGCPNPITASSKAEAASFLYNPRIEGIANHAEIYRRYEKAISEM